MNWGSIDAFFAMGGHAFYVWGSYFVTFALMAAEVLLLARRRRGILAMLRRVSSTAGSAS
jgi:heme exporter protein D